MMTERWIGRIAAFAMLFAFPAAMMSAGLNTAMLSGTGQFALNGAVVPQHVAVLQGDKITTQSNAAAALTTQGNSVVISANSAVVYRGNDIELDAGTAQVNTQRNMAVHVAKLTVSPAKANGTYRVTHTSGVVLVAALHGSVAISDGVETHTVPQGNTAAVPDPAPQQQRPPAASSSAPHVSTAVAIVAGVGAAAASAALAIASTGTPNSPSVP